jgi:hypothetical protein
MRLVIYEDEKMDSTSLRNTALIICSASELEKTLVRLSERLA